MLMRIVSTCVRTASKEPPPYSVAFQRFLLSFPRRTLLPRDWHLWAGELVWRRRRPQRRRILEHPQVGLQTPEPVAGAHSPVGFKLESRLLVPFVELDQDPFPPSAHHHLDFYAIIQRFP